MKKDTRDMLWTVGGSIAAVVLLGACFGQPDLPGPVVYIRLGESYEFVPLAPIGATRWTDADKKWIQSGTQEWRRLGFDVRGLDETPDLTLPPTDIIVIDIYRDMYVQEKNYGGMSDRAKHQIFINPSATDYTLVGYVAHEMGHQLLNTADHLPAGARGVMTPNTNSWSLTQADYDFACQIAQRCERF